MFVIVLMFERSLTGINLSIISNVQNVICTEITKVRITQRCQLVRFTRKPYGFLRFAQAYGRTMQFLRIIMIFADSNL